jgi:hypothetical protein
LLPFLHILSNKFALTIQKMGFKGSLAPATSYSGAAIVAAAGMNLAAFGSYAKLQSGHPSVFLFAKLQSDKGIGPPYFNVKGLAGGFGYNWRLRLPAQDEVVTFPLVQSAAGNTNALGPQQTNSLAGVLNVLNVLKTGSNPWLRPSLGDMWLAAGITFSSFEFVQAQALLIAEFGREFQAALLGDISMRLPPSKIGPALAYVELGLEALLKPATGFFGLTAQLSPNSYVLHPNCHLTGGFAFYLWFKDQLTPPGPKAGEFVITLGGYHPAFKAQKPAWYPEEPRLGLNWRVNDQIAITGGCYFALTPSCAMAGVALNAVFKSGDLQAWFKADADFLAYWQPLHYEAEIGISVGAAYRLNLGFTDKTFKAELGANLQLWGPSLGGKVSVHWHVISITIDLGAERPKIISDVDWQAFKALLPTTPPATTVNNTRITITGGLMREDIIQTSHRWIVRPEAFRFQIESVIPVNHISFNGTDMLGGAPQINIKPMGKKAINSSQLITIQPLVPQQQQPAWQTTVLTRYLPEALWGEKPANEKTPSASAKMLKDPLWVGVTVQAPLAKAGRTLGPVAMNQAVVLHGVLPLSSDQPTTDDQIQANPQAIQIIQDTVGPPPGNTALPPTALQRANLASYLTRIGLFKARQLDTMERLAANAANEFSETPLVRTQHPPS